MFNNSFFTENVVKPIVLCNFIVGAIALVFLINHKTLGKDLKRYEVEVTYCDERPKKVVIVNSRTEPNNLDIYTHQVAVPKWRNHLNVCEIRVIK